MKTLIPWLVIAALNVVAPARSEAQVRISVDVGVGYRWGHGWRSSYWHRGRDCYAHSRFGCYQRDVVVVRRPVYRPPVVVVRPGYRHAYRRDYRYRRHHW
ncbi:MAG: hypothetical protein HY560_02520 [Gemmatimonadetes bacterium]|nr:hypothetical protein [Gemmatimonadota bacterium]